MSDKPIASLRGLAADGSGSADTDQRTAARTDEGPGAFSAHPLIC
jgi:hypothetical protein